MTCHQVNPTMFDSLTPGAILMFVSQKMSTIFLNMDTNAFFFCTFIFTFNFSPLAFT